MKRIGIVEDHEDMQIIYRRILRKVRDIEIVLQVSTAEEALEKIPQAALDLIIIDISLPGMDGLSLAKELRKRYPGLKILIATGYTKEAYEAISKETGAHGFVTKEEGTEIVNAVCTLLDLSNNGTGKQRECS